MSRKKRNLAAETAAAAWHEKHSLGIPEDPKPQHVVISKLLRKVLQEAWDRGYLKDAVTGNDAAFEQRVNAALSVSKKAVTKDSQ